MSLKDQDSNHRASSLTCFACQREVPANKIFAFAGEFFCKECYKKARRLYKEERRAGVKLPRRKSPIFTKAIFLQLVAVAAIQAVILIQAISRHRTALLIVSFVHLLVLVSLLDHYLSKTRTFRLFYTIYTVVSSCVWAAVILLDSRADLSNVNTIKSVMDAVIISGVAQFLRLKSAEAKAAFANDPNEAFLKRLLLRFKKKR